ncbi:response regulator transcription factor [Parasphingorhabdus litoris]|uniref:Response regulator transcription factor n=1 Tax=Parasphingorhabdus litoris TaxID=394733 RepID=A0ABN1B167_9SPHN|nr:LuxR C-terminal-related transcriptional regulator [Parasphingorhabdus litoris]
MNRTVLSRTIFYAIALAMAAFFLQWLEYRFFLKTIPTDIYIVVLAILFVSLGIWVGQRLTVQKTGTAFERNDPALKALGISNRELEVLEAMATGQSNKEIARSLGISPNTIKTHIAHLFEKLSVDRRVLAIEKAKSLHLIP